MELSEFTATDDRVVVEGYNSGIMIPTGRPYEYNWVMPFTVRDGKIVRYRHYYDTNDLLVALRAR